MKTNETKFWICDNCGGKIESIEDGWVEWLVKQDDAISYNKSYGMRIVHRVKCIYDETLIYKKENAIVSDIDLESFLGADGLMDLLSFLSDGYFKESEEVLEIIKRIHIPGYEEARFYFEEAIGYGVFEPNTKPGYYSQRDIMSVLEYIKTKENK